MIKAAKMCDHGPYRPNNSIDTPWFDAEKERIFRKAFNVRIHQSNEVKPGLYDEVSLNLSAEPDMSLQQPQLSITQASLSKRILEESKKKVTV